MTVASSFKTLSLALIVSVLTISSASAQTHTGATTSWKAALAEEPAKQPKQRSTITHTVAMVPPARSVTAPQAIKTVSEKVADIAAKVQTPEPDLKGLASELLVTPPSITPDIEQRQYERDAGYRKLKQQLQDLMRRVESRQNFDEPAQSEDATDVTAKSPAKTQQAPVDTTVEEDTATSPEQPQTPETETPLNPVVDDPTENATQKTTAEENRSVFLDSLKAATVVDGPVDRIGLADNLYALDELTISLEMYEKVNTKDISASERYWVAFQRASCHRRLGQRDESRELYRRLAGQQSAGWLAKTSRWWLDQMDLREQLETKITAQTDVLKKFSELYPAESADEVPDPQPGI